MHLGSVVSRKPFSTFTRDLGTLSEVVYPPELIVPSKNIVLAIFGTVILDVR